MLGAGWSITGPGPAPHAVVILIKVDWNEANEQHKFALRLVDSDGGVVHVPSPAGTQAMEFSGNLEVGRPPGIPAGSEIDASFVVGLQPLPLAGGQRYTWRLQVGDDELASEGFFVRPQGPPAGPVQPGPATAL